MIGKRAQGLFKPCLVDPDPQDQSGDDSAADKVGRNDKPGVWSKIHEHYSAGCAVADAAAGRAAEAVRDGRASSLLSAGNTGAAMAASMLRMGRIKGVARPAIAVPFPVVGSTPSTLLDCGANADCQPEWLVQFARLGTAYARERFGLENPRVATLTIGEEAGKGNTLVKEACALLEQSEWAEECGARYIGNVEGGDLMAGVADVIVCDGFTGNIALKTAEGTASLVSGLLRDAFNATILSKVSALLALSSLRRLSKRVDPRRNNGGVFLGLNGTVVKSHGAADAMGFSAAVKLAFQLAQSGFSDKLAARVASAATLQQDAATTSDNKSG